MRTQRGLSLVELMIAITLGLILMTGVVQVFLSSRAVFSSQQAISRIQETGRLAIEFLAKDIRMAGYMGCATRASSMKVTNTLNDAANYSFDFNTAIRGYAASAFPSGTTISPTPEANTDVIVLRASSGPGVKVVKNNSGAQVFASGSTVAPGACSDGTDMIGGLCQNDILVVSDCIKARVFQATSINVASGEANINHAATGTPGNAISSWGGSSGPEEESFKPGAEVFIATNTTYFIGLGTSGRPSLWQNINGTNLELLEGVEDISIKYGEDTSATKDYIPDNYVAASAVTNWNNVVAVRIELLVASVEDGVVPEAQRYSFDGANNVLPNPVDRRLRQVFVSTVGIRSRVF